MEPCSPLASVCSCGLPMDQADTKRHHTKGLGFSCLPIDQFIAANNANDVVTNYLLSGNYIFIAANDDMSTINTTRNVIVAIS